MTKQLLVDIQKFNFHLLENFNPRKIRRGIFWGHFCLFSIIPVTLTPEYPPGDYLSLIVFLRPGSALVSRSFADRHSRVPSFLVLISFRVSREQ